MRTIAFVAFCESWGPPAFSDPLMSASIPRAIGHVAPHLRSTVYGVLYNFYLVR
jgi:hypothetical protein